MLPKIAWVTTFRQGFEPFIPSTDQISLKSVIATSLGGRLSPEQKNLLSRTNDRMQQLGPADPAMEVFTKSAYDGGVYHIQVQLVDESNGVLTVFQLYITLDTSESSASDVFLLHEYAKNAVTIQVAFEAITLNSALYVTIRQSIIDKLGPKRTARQIHALFDNESTS